MTGPTRTLFSRRLLLGVFILFLLTTACNLPAQTPSPVGTFVPTAQVTFSPFPSQAAENIPPTAVIPVTGADEVTLQCQFCVNDEPHAVIILSELAGYYTSETTSRITCLTTQVTNGRRILLCRGAQQASFNLNVCYESASCLQFPVTLDTCLVSPRPGAARSPTPFVLTPINSGVAPPTLTSPAVALPTQTSIAPTPTQTAIAPAPLPTQTVFAPPPVAATTAVSSSHASPTRAAPQQPALGPQDPGEFVRWYFGAVWQSRNYEELWNNYLTPSFKSRISSGGYDEYVQWWSSVERVDVNSVQVMENDGTHAWVHVNVTFTMKDGRVIDNQEYDYDLLFDPVRKTWMFDYNV